MANCLRTCRSCGLQAKTKKDLKLFRFSKTSLHERMNICYSCHNKATKEWREKNKELNSELIRNWAKNNRHKRNASEAKRRSTKLNATPPWAINEKVRIEFLYSTAQNQGLHVDHIVPLQGKTVCGLHCLSNLQLLEPSENISKSNKLFL